MWAAATARRSHHAAVALGDLCPADARIAAAIDPAVLNSAPPAAMRHTLGYLRQRYGGVESYLDSIGAHFRAALPAWCSACVPAAGRASVC